MDNTTIISGLTTGKSSETIPPPGGEDEDGAPFEKKGRDPQPTMTDGLGPLY